MRRLALPRSDVNDDSAVLLRWLVADGAPVEAGAPVCVLETAKSVFDLPAPTGGTLRHAAREGDEIAFDATLGWLASSPDEELPVATPSVSAANAGYRATKAAQALADKHGLDLGTLGKSGIITVDDLEGLVQTRHAYYETHPKLRKVVLLGSGRVATQVIDILLNDPHTRIVGCLDDQATMHGKEILGVRVLGPIERLGEMHRAGHCDAAVVCVGTNLKVRKALFERCRQEGVPLANVIDPSARLNRYTVMGQGNIVCSFVHLGVGAELGDNCFLAAHTSLDHHCLLGSHILLGPGCLLSGTVTVGDETLMGSGVVIQPNLTVGEGCLIASGAVITTDVPARHAVKTRVHTTIVPR